VVRVRWIASLSGADTAASCLAVTVMVMVISAVEMGKVKVPNPRMVEAKNKTDVLSSCV
jgi:hypothetical protein